MINIDIIFVTYNSQKWLDKCIESIVKNDYELKNIHLFFSDNNSSDDTIKVLEQMKFKYEKNFGDFIIIKNKKNLGFGRANNIAAKMGKSPYIFIYNVDTQMHEDTLKKLSSELENLPKEAGALELRQEPYEHPKYYDPITMETNWSSGACVCIKREAYEKVNGFDKFLFMYSEDVDLSWNLRQRGYKIYYSYDVSIIHHSYKESGEFKATQYIYGIVNNLYLRYKYGNIKNMLKGNLMIWRRILTNTDNIGKKVTKRESIKIRERIFLEYLKTTLKAIVAIPINLGSRFYRNKNFKPKFIGFDYEVSKDGAFYVKKELKTNPLVSVIVRTHDRPAVLRENLISLRNQVYKNIEIVIVEDGKPKAQKMLEEEFSDLNIVYQATNEKTNRCVVGNTAMHLATGKYLNFLDDDDLFYPDHISTLVSELESSNYAISYTTAFETPIKIISKNPYVYKVVDKIVRYSVAFSRKYLFNTNITPIQSVMFKKEVFNNLGGFDEEIDALEDWDLWIRYATKYDFLFIKRTTSIYRVPARKKILSERQNDLDIPLKYLHEKFKTYKVEVTVDEFIE